MTKQAAPVSLPSYLPAPRDPAVLHASAGYHDVVVEDLGGGSLWATIYYHGDVVAEGATDGAADAKAWLNEIVEEQAEEARLWAEDAAG